jgi:phage terminase small subunit
MPALTNIRRERFVRHYIKTGIASQAYKAAGYVANTRGALDSSAYNLLRIPEVKSRIAEVRRQMTYRTRITLESLLAELAQDRELARRVDQPSAAIQATVVQAKLVGLMVDRKESGAPGDFAGLTTVDEIVAKARVELGEDAAAMLLAVLGKSEPAEPVEIPAPESAALN